MICSGIDALGGAPVEVRFDRTLTSVSGGPAAVDYLAPGWIDIQVNGFAGVDYNEPAAPLEEIARSVQVLYSTGVTRFYPTLITGPETRIVGALRNLVRAAETLPEGAAIEGFHVEGPHISPDDGPRGAHPQRWVRQPDLDEFHRWQEAAGGRIRIVTLAPEWPEATRYIEKIVELGVVAAIGHTAAEPRQITEAVRAGATLSTHLGNGAHSTMRRHPNYLWEQLAEDRLMADFIVDGIHLPAAYLKVALRAKGPALAALVTDAAMPAGCVPGRYKLGEQDVELTADNRVVLLGKERLAGSALLMHHAVGNVMRLAGLSLADAVRMATVNAARAGKVAGRTRGLVAGERADLVLFGLDPATSRLTVKGTWVDGQRVFG